MNRYLLQLIKDVNILVYVYVERYVNFSILDARIRVPLISWHEFFVLRKDPCSSKISKSFKTRIEKLGHNEAKHIPVMRNDI